MKHNRPCKTADEVDAVSKSHRDHGSLNKAGARNAIKTRIRRRERRSVRQELRYER